MCLDPSTNKMGNLNPSPVNVGIRAMELYFPKNYVEQSELEKFDGASSGRYTIGLGLQQMGFCGVEEDVTSMCLTVVSSLLKNYQIDRKSIGYISVGTECATDKSKGLFTSLMEFFGEKQLIRGHQHVGACYAGTSALFSAIDWVYRKWGREKRYALVVMADIAVYAKGSARCTGGAGAFAALVGPDAAIVFDDDLEVTLLSDTWDFYKPISGVSSEYPMVDGQLSLKSYLGMVDAAYVEYRSKASALNGSDVTLSSFDAIMMHCPFSKIVQKAVGRLAYADYLRGVRDGLVDPEKLASLCPLSSEGSFADRSFNTAITEASANIWKAKVESNLLFNRRIGNMYTSSLYAQLFAMFNRFASPELMQGKKILFFSYGSGAAAAMFTAVVSSEKSSEVLHQLECIKRSADSAAARLESRTLFSPVDYTNVLLAREKFVQGTKLCELVGGFGDHLNGLKHYPGTYTLKAVDEMSKRFYECA